MRKHVACGAALAFVCAAAGGVTEDFRWNLDGSAQTRTWRAAEVPETGAYTVRLRMAMAGKKGARIEFHIDGATVCCDGGSANGLDVDGQHRLQCDMRNGRYHDWVFAVDGGKLHVKFDGDARAPLKAGGVRGFSLTATCAMVDVRGAEAVPGNRFAEWPSRNLIQNGGFETLANGFAYGWTTGRFGFGTYADIASAGETRRRYRIERGDAFEGAHAMRIGVSRGEKSFPLWECWRNRPNDADYVLSVYAKALRPGTQLMLMAGEGDRTFARKVFGLTNAWTRLSMPFRHGKGSQLRGGFEIAGAEGEALLDNAQLECGTNATAFVPGIVKCEEAPPDSPKVMDRYYSEGPFAPVATNLPVRFAHLDAKRNSIHFGAEEYFPYGFNTESPYMGRESFVKTLDLFAANGFNYIKCPVIGRTCEPGVLKEMMDEAWKRGMRVMLGLQTEKDFMQSPAAVAAAAAVKDHPAFLSASIIDEGSLKAIKPEVRMARADAVRAALGGRIPVFMNECDLGVVTRESFAAADIAGIDVYEVGFGEISSLYYVLKQFRDQVPERVKCFYPMCSGGITADWPRDATRDEVLAQAYIGYVLDIFGIFWWQGIPLTEEALEAVAQAKRERDAIGPASFLDGVPADVRCFSRNDAVKFSARRRGNVTTVIALNIENRPNGATWMFPAEMRGVRAKIGKAPGMGEGKRQGMLEDSFGPLERRVFEVY